MRATATWGLLAAVAIHSGRLVAEGQGEQAPPSEALLSGELQSPAAIYHVTTASTGVLLHHGAAGAGDGVLVRSLWPASPSATFLVDGDQSTGPTGRQSRGRWLRTAAAYRILDRVVVGLGEAWRQDRRRHERAWTEGAVILKGADAEVELAQWGGGQTRIRGRRLVMVSRPLWLELVLLADHEGPAAARSSRLGAQGSLKGQLGPWVWRAAFGTIAGPGAMLPTPKALSLPQGELAGHYRLSSPWTLTGWLTLGRRPLLAMGAARDWP